MADNQASPGFARTVRTPRIGASPASRNGESRGWICEICGQGFKKKEHLARHIRSHTKEKPFRCDVCSKSYGRHDSLIRHSRKHVKTHQTGPLRLPSTALPSPSGSEPVDTHGIDDVAFQPGNDASMPQDTAASTDSREHSQLGSLDSCCETGGGQWGGTESSVPGQPLNFDFMHFGVDVDQSFWLLGEELYQSIQNESFPLIPPYRDNHLLANAGQTQSWDTRGSFPGAYPTRAPRLESCKTIHDRWHTRPNLDAVSQAQPFGMENREQVDENYRTGLSVRLQSNPEDSVLPSAEFLNLSIKLYFTKFHPIFPIVHAPSFRPSSENALLLLSICSIGALFVGSPGARERGRAIFLRLNKAILASWESYVYQGGREALAIAQAVTLGQTFGMLSGTPNDLLLADTFHGTIIAWARQAGIFRTNDTIEAVKLPDPSDLEASWRSWIQREESARVMLALHVHDSEFSALLHHEPLLRHEPNRLPHCASEAVFSASTPSRWYELLKSSQAVVSPEPGSYLAANPQPLMSAYATLASIYASISELKSRSLGDDEISNRRDSLILWCEAHPTLAATSENDPCSLLVLWHEAFIALHVSFNLLERVIGRDGNLPTEEDSTLVHHWANGPDGRHCVAHALLILKRLEALPISIEPAVHIPKAVFFTGLIIYCYAKYSEPGNRHISFDLPELQASIARHGWTNSGFGPSSHTYIPRVDPSIFNDVVDLLRRHGHWGISRKFASILEALMEELADSWERGN